MSPGTVAVLFVAGLASIVTPCVLPLVPGYLSAVSAVEADRLGQRGTVRRVLVGSVPFFLGFTIVFVALGAAAAAIGSVLSIDRRSELTGFLLVVFGLALSGALPIPERLFAPELLGAARRRGSFFLGAAFSFCAAPCVGGVLGTALALASNAGTVVQGSALLAVYSVGLALGFVLVAVAFTRAMGAFRWLRDRYVPIQIVSGALLVALGILFFLHREWWIRVYLNRALEWLGLGSLL